MRETMTTQPTPETDAEYIAAIDEMLGEMDRLNEQMRRDQAETDRLRAETEAIIAQTPPLVKEDRTLLLEMHAMLERLLRDRELEDLKHENRMLLLENALRRIEQRLPPGSPPDTEGKQE